ncbi:MAG TPA: ATP-binding protein, partial [Chthoniobacterales bacterium]|nr:ATP-binding protein [Chthoniobacterales bacterium]
MLRECNPRFELAERGSFEPHAQMRPRLHPCPCGYFGDLKRECRCSPVQVQRYRQRISGPLLDRIDLHIE